MTDSPQSDDQPSEPDGDPDGDSLFGKSIRGLLWTAADRGGTSIVSILVHIALARLLVPRHFGLVAMARVAVAFLHLLKDQGFEEALIQRSDLEDAHIDSALWTLAGTGVVLAAAGVAASPWVAAFFDEPALEAVFQVLLLNLPIVAATSVPTALLKRQMRFKVLSLRSLFAVVFGGAVGVGMALLDFGVWSLVFKNVASTLVGAAVLWSAVDWRPRWSYSWSHTRALFSFGANVTAERVLNYFNRQFDDLIIGRVLGSTALGYYSVAYEILKGLTNLLSRTVSQVALPAFSRLQDRRDEMRRAYYAALKLVSYVAFPVFFLYIALAPELVLVVYGTKWAQSIPVAQVLGGIGVLHSVLLLNPQVLKACGKPSWELGITILNVTLNVTGFVIAVQYGIVAVAAAYVIRGYVTFPVEFWVARRLIGIEVGEYFRILAFPIVGCGLMLAGIYGLKFALPTGVPVAARFAALIAAGSVVYVLYLQLFLPESARDFLDRARSVLQADDSS